MSSIKELLGRLLVLIIYCSVILTSSKLTAQYKMQISKKNAEEFISEAYQSGLNNSLYSTFVGSELAMGYTVELSLVGRERILNDQELRNQIAIAPLTIQKDEFLTCRLSSKKIVLRIGGRI